jgi:hypothetical protein
LISTVSWLVLAEGQDDRKRSGINASVAVSLSVLGNGIEHLNAFHVLTVGWPVVIAVSAIPPVVTALSVHLAVRFLAETEEAQTVPTVVVLAPGGEQVAMTNPSLAQVKAAAGL